MPALLERPKLSNAMARALHRHIMLERERKRQEEEEVDKMMEQKMREEQERRRKKEMEERMSLEETREQIQKLQEKLSVLQEEKHQLFLQLKKVLHEEEKRRRKEQSDMTTLTSAAYQQGLAVHAGTHLLSMQGSPGGHSRQASLMADRNKQMFGPPVIPRSHFTGQGGFTPSTPEHGQYAASQSSHSPYAVSQTQHTFGAGQAVPVSYTSGQQIRGPSAFQAMQYLSHQQPSYGVHGHFPAAQSGFIPPSTGIPLQKQLEHANQQSGFTDSSTIRPMHPQALHPAQTLLPAPQISVQMQPAKSALAYTHPPRPASPGSFSHGTPPQQAHASGFQATTQQAPRHPFIQHGQGQRFYPK
uniref:G protein pathway suppressor 2 isoform X1 n=1 Tax=Geotrypetes seraphini TaxID=260995 RepID=A0A6P8PE41_GEOSA|nr:G protein pathway suppressor 2 isoform X1 [Geotrypetes seraphini]XP_033779406.1 G protein pathway suppressor 2 isoform X1 [Geotrypetes seraphini]